MQRGELTELRQRGVRAEVDDVEARGLSAPQAPGEHDLEQRLIAPHRQLSLAPQPTTAGDPRVQTREERLELVDGQRPPIAD